MVLRSSHRLIRCITCLLPGDYIDQRSVTFTIQLKYAVSTICVCQVESLRGALATAAQERATALEAHAACAQQLSAMTAQLRAAEIAIEVRTI